MKFNLVGNRDGKATINWRGVLASSVILGFVAIAGSALFVFAVSWFSLDALLLPAMTGVAMVIVMGIRYGLKLPLDQLPRLD
jgi:hypothetical protein